MLKHPCFQLLLLFSLIFATFGYDTAIAHDLAHLTNIAYEKQANINAWNCSDCSNFQMKFQKVFYSSVSDIQGYAGYFPKQNAIVVSFRGSVDTKNWIFNLNYEQTPYPSCTGCLIHTGFYTAYLAASPVVRTEVDRLKNLYKSALLVITGHSLGGAMAIIAGLQLKQIYGNVDYIYTYGQPRVGNKNFASFTQARISQIFRVINYADQVPHIPPLPVNFQHGGLQVWYSPKGMKEYKICQPETQTCSNSISPTARSIDDHNMSYYITLAVTGNKQNKSLRINRLIQPGIQSLDQKMQKEKEKRMITLDA